MRFLFQCEATCVILDNESPLHRCPLLLLLSKALLLVIVKDAECLWHRHRRQIDEGGGTATRLTLHSALALLLVLAAQSQATGLNFLLLQALPGFPVNLQAHTGNSER